LLVTVHEQQQEVVMHRFVRKWATAGALWVASLSPAWAQSISLTESVVTSPGVALVDAYRWSSQYETLVSYISTGDYVNEVVSRSDPFGFYVDSDGLTYAFQEVTRRSGRDVTANFAVQSYAGVQYYFDTESGTGYNYVEASIDLLTDAASISIYGTGRYGEVTHPRTGAEALVSAAWALDGETLGGMNHYGYYADQWYGSYSESGLAAGTYLLSVDNFPGGTVQYLSFVAYSQLHGFFEKSFFEGSEFISTERVLVTAVPEPAPVLLVLAGCAVALRMRQRARAVAST
jgi:hypothetical protein